MTERFPLGQQIAGAEILLRKGREILTKAGARAHEAERILAQQEQLIATARTIEPYQNEVRALVKRLKGGQA